MRNPFAHRGPLWTNETPLWERVLQAIALAVVVVGVAVIAAGQITSPNERVLQVVAAGIVVFLAFRLRSISALSFLVLLLPFPKATSYGNTNVAFSMLLFLVWMFRVSTRREPPPIRTPLELPLIGLVMAYCLSFYNVEPENLAQAWAQFLNFLTYVLVLFLVVNIVRTSRDVKQIFGFQLVTCVIVCALAVYEQSHPGSRIIPGWIEFGKIGPSEGAPQSVRVGSTFLDYELFGEFCALNLFLQAFLWTRATSQTRRWVLVGCMTLTLFCLFSTVTRGAILAFLVGSTYLVWLVRRRLNFVRFVGIAFLLFGAILGGDFVVSTFTNSDSVLERLGGTKFEDGMPDTRAGAWKQSMRHIMNHPIFGHGPYFAPRSGVEMIYWPHNVYLFYAHIVGLVGLAFYLWLLWTLWRATRPQSPSLGAGSYIQGATILARVMLFTFIIDQVKIDYLRNPRYSFFIWFLLGLLWAIGAVARREAAARDATPVLAAVPPLPPSTAVRPGGVAARPAIQRVSTTPAVGPR
jgi:O-antigen ligase